MWGGLRQSALFFDRTVCYGVVGGLSFLHGGFMCDSCMGDVPVRQLILEDSAVLGSFCDKCMPAAQLVCQVHVMATLVDDDFGEDW